MGELVFVGLGLHDEKGISVKGLEEAKTAAKVFLELYTSLLPGFSLENLETLTGRRVQVVVRRDLEDDDGRIVLDAAAAGKAVFLVPGDPFVATTHVSLRLEAAKRGVKTRIVHAASIVSAVAGLSGLHSYKFGKTVTVPFPENFSETPYNVIAQNRERGLHTLCLLDLKADEKRFLSVNDALALLMEMEKKKQKGAVALDSFAVGFARVGSDLPVLRADTVNRLSGFDFGAPPHCLVFLGALHFMEADSLVAFAGAPVELRRVAR